MDKNYSDIVMEWLKKAESDFQYAKLSFEAFDSFYAQICVLCHDSAEKYLKAYILYHGMQPEKIHDLVTLYKQCAEIGKEDSELGGLEEKSRVLNRYYVPLKYPSHYPAVDREKTKEAMEAAEEIRKVVGFRLLGKTKDGGRRGVGGL